MKMMLFCISKSTFPEVSVVSRSQYVQILKLRFLYWIKTASFILFCLCICFVLIS